MKTITIRDGDEEWEIQLPESIFNRLGKDQISYWSKKEVGCHSSWFPILTSLGHSPDKFGQFEYYMIEISP